MSGKEKEIPQRRFKKFKNADVWELRKLVDEVELFSGLTYSPNDVVRGNGTLVLRSSNVKNGEIINADNVYVNSSIVNSCNVKDGDVIVVVRNGSRSLIGKHAQIKGNMNNTVIGAFMAGIRSVQPAFINALLNTQVFDSEVGKNLGATINQITSGMFQQMNFMFPKSEEQIQIGEMFTQLDNLIILHQNKLEKMKVLKKAYLTEMFPAEGERRPKRRFAGFTDDWEERKFSDNYKVCAGYAFKYQDYTDNGITIINGESIQYGNINCTNFNYLPECFREEYSEYFLQEGDIVVGLNRPIIDGNLKISRIPKHLDGSLLYQRAGKIKHVTDINVDFSFVLLEKEILKHTIKEAVGSDQPFISTSKLDKWKMFIPGADDERKEIGAFFKQFDNLIIIQQNKLEKLKNIKKAYLNEMFV